MAGRISLLIDSPLRDFQLAMRGLPAEVRTEIGKHTKAQAQPLWRREIAHRASTRLQIRALSDSAAVGVTARNVLLRAGWTGRLSTGTPVRLVSRAAEFGANPNTPIRTKSRTGKPYTRRTGTAFGNGVNRHGHTFYPSAWESVSLFASLWIQTAKRTTAERIESVT
jgi:hypothetical protein